MLSDVSYRFKGGVEFKGLITFLYSVFQGIVRTCFSKVYGVEGAFDFAGTRLVNISLKKTCSFT